MEPTQLTSLLSQPTVYPFKAANAVGQPSPQTGQLSRPENTDLSRSVLNPNSPQQLINQQIMARLNERLESEGLGKAEDLNPSEFTPEKVADRILGFVRNGLALAAANGANEDEVSSLMESARKGIEEGFQEAKNILEGLGALNNEAVASGINRTYELLQQGLDKLENPAATAAAVATTALSEASSYRRSEQISLELTTREGDRVTLLVERNSGADESRQLQRDENGSRLSASNSSYAESRLTYSVEGDLNEDERAAIDGLMKRIDKVSDRFFDGQTQAALSQAANINHNSDEIVSYSLGLAKSEVSTRAVSAYQSVGQLGSPVMGEEVNDTPPTEKFRKMGEYLQELQNAMKESKMGQLFMAPEESAANLFKGSLQMDERFGESMARLEQQSADAMQRVNDALIDSLVKRNEERVAQEPVSQVDSNSAAKEQKVTDMV
ncbi:MAG: DUF5610 domain-containing protein [Gammaproteobacteria bacterium]|nr:DUF5610 domain-containing protein [Gammaproteobacteria bacterium]